MSDPPSVVETWLPAASRAEAEAWSLVLSAEGILHRVGATDGRWFVGVESDSVERARAHIATWASENAPPPAPPAAPDPDLPTNAGFFIAGALIAFFFVTGDWDPQSEYFRRGATDARRVLGGEVWRVVTALTLHSDPAHVLGNAFSCAVFGTLLLRRYGVGLGAWLLLASGALGNGLSAVWEGSMYRSVGASTALFGAIGALASTELVRRRRLALGWSQAWLPIAGGIALLAMLGTGRGSDLTAHVMGLAIGAALGFVAAREIKTPPLPGMQRALAALALGAVALAWATALA